MSHFRHLIGVGHANNCETYREWAGWTTIASFHIRILSETDTTARFPHFDIILNTSFSPCFTWGRRIKGEKWRHKDRALWGASNDSLYEPCCMTFKCLSSFFFFRSFSASLAFGIKHRNYSNFFRCSRQTLANLGNVNRTQCPLWRTNPTSDSKSPRLCYSRSQVCTLWTEKWPQTLIVITC